MSDLCVQETFSFLPDAPSWEHTRPLYSFPIRILTSCHYWPLFIDLCPSARLLRKPRRITCSYPWPVHSVIGQGCHLLTTGLNWEGKKAYGCTVAWAHIVTRFTFIASSNGDAVTIVSIESIQYKSQYKMVGGGGEAGGWKSETITALREKSRTNNRAVRSCY